MSTYKRKPLWAIDLEWRALQAQRKYDANEQVRFYRPPSPVCPRSKGIAGAVNGFIWGALGWLCLGAIWMLWELFR